LSWSLWESEAIVLLAFLSSTLVIHKSRTSYKTILIIYTSNCYGLKPQKCASARIEALAENTGADALTTLHEGSVQQPDTLRSSISASTKGIFQRYNADPAA
jgi:hypothetical protein